MNKYFDEHQKSISNPIRQEERKHLCGELIKWIDYRLDQIANPAEAGDFLIDELEELKKTLSQQL